MPARTDAERHSPARMASPGGIPCMRTGVAIQEDLSRVAHCGLHSRCGHTGEVMRPRAAEAAAVEEEHILADLGRLRYARDVHIQNLLSGCVCSNADISLSVERCLQLFAAVYRGCVEGSVRIALPTLCDHSWRVCVRLPDWTAE